MDDRTIIDQITALVAEEQRLQEQPDHSPARLQEVEVMLDELWDLLRQRRAKREFGENPDEASVRDANTVEGYRQ
jgi:hypothetical protein